MKNMNDNNINHLLVNTPLHILNNIIKLLDDNLDRICFSIVCKRWYQEKEHYLVFLHDNSFIDKLCLNVDNNYLNCFKSFQNIIEYTVNKHLNNENLRLNDNENRVYNDTNVKLDVYDGRDRNTVFNHDIDYEYIKINICDWFITEGYFPPKVRELHIGSVEMDSLNFGYGVIPKTVKILRFTEQPDHHSYIPPSVELLQIDHRPPWYKEISFLYKFKFPKSLRELFINSKDLTNDHPINSLPEHIVTIRVKFDEGPHYINYRRLDSKNYIVYSNGINDPYFNAGFLQINNNNNDKSISSFFKKLFSIK
ncbi:hypothetical protein PPL_00072 [Heterostelium album PN500]|uniref:COI1 F-box domain-containing protein n=1 Tax=Heterostelium pallidum (strain ATCC 26659 / Pp 5 / PN500) TaxID=670386 RepID=D3AVG2_HETP5|nr:hypothetical protein PPL_00072 [Heterostelium album PN500]EFA86285.1 hypothetical protein PPL_00072 [Heterostelium album PN500]|eukprot:XP_020438390.1 hypothetical protein PPL_00072 [Heterostelium album PN500]